uniref:C2H2-type domain-containing protein n=1 Tax=Plectus sambesii TaxID=2011161 RepID=A0A914XLF9_9BILA
MSSQQQAGEKVSQSATPRNNSGGKALRPQQQQNSSKQDKRGDRSSGNRPAKPSHNQPSHNQSAAQSGGAKIPHKKPPPAGATNSQANGFDKSRIRQESISPTVCIICCCESDLFSIGMCGHPVCLECGTRIRVLGKNNLCSHCRLDLPEVYFVPFAGSWDDWIPPHNCINDRHGAQYGIKFGNKDALNAFSDYLAHVCTVCPKEPSFPTFQELKQHMSRQHDLYYCDLCVEHLQLYSWERKCYSRKELDTHRRLGDGDDKSHRGHPDCKFCNSRFLDHDHLYRHLRRDHFYCQLCDADGDSNTFY